MDIDCIAFEFTEVLTLNLFFTISVEGLVETGKNNPR